jgi:hypothetical protein
MYMYILCVDLSGAFLGTELRDRAVYLRLLAEAGEYAGKILLLLKSVYGLKTSGRDKQGHIAPSLYGRRPTARCGSLLRSHKEEVGHRDSY